MARVGVARVCVLTLDAQPWDVGMVGCGSTTALSTHPVPTQFLH